ncbi:MAG: hypothetical protein ACLP8S_21195 [Solirubrobacteraceae bacterium]
MSSTDVSDDHASELAGATCVDGGLEVIGIPVSTSTSFHSSAMFSTWERR